MKNEKTFSGVAYMFLGAALLISGASVQEQIERLSSDPGLQMAKAMYASLWSGNVEANTGFLAVNAPAERQLSMPVAFDHGAVVPEMPAPVVAHPVLRRVERVEVVEVVAPEFPHVEVEVAPLPRELAPVRPSRMKIHLLKVQARMAALKALPRNFEFHFASAAPAIDMERLELLKAEAEKAAACADSESKTEVKTEL